MPYIIPYFAPDFKHQPSLSFTKFAAKKYEKGRGLTRDPRRNNNTNKQTNN